MLTATTPVELPAAAFLFADIVSFTAYTETHGDAAAAALAWRLRLGVEEQLGADAHIVKTLGDAVMVRIADPAGAAACTMDLPSSATAISSAPPSTSPRTSPRSRRRARCSSRTHSPLPPASARCAAARSHLRPSASACCATWSFPSSFTAPSRASADDRRPRHAPTRR